MVAINDMNSADLWGNRIFEKAKAARLEVKVPTRHTETTIAMLFLKPDRSGTFFQISRYFAKLAGRGISWGGMIKIDCRTFREVESIHKKGKTIITVPASSMAIETRSKIDF
jgi:hypothetical protein